MNILEYRFQRHMKITTPTATCLTNGGGVEKAALQCHHSPLLGYLVGQTIEGAREEPGEAGAATML
jgi:hypothetical protein